MLHTWQVSYYLREKESIVAYEEMNDLSSGGKLPSGIQADVSVEPILKCTDTFHALLSAEVQYLMLDKHEVFP